MQQTKNKPSLKRRNRLVSIIVVVVWATLFAAGFSLIIFK
ncbi:MAG: hypothetical protein ETSY1_24620 [Candidatus Entotheonella factor]|uniref:Uncharacterized protein n=1 Tax=Entotheonella factor TaxID=1429438 RepID=W4LG23_ENTF1|nr:MAG: hypothetical protein ETSY1_24620 [Candidatus Entotheonella factor]